MTPPGGDFPAATVTRDPAATIRELKEQSGKDIWLWGSLKLMHSLLEAGVVDEVGIQAGAASQATKTDAGSGGAGGARGLVPSVAPR